MYLGSGWRILTVGDGDLSFSLSLHQSGVSLAASVLDSEYQLLAKYQDCAYHDLISSGIPVFTGLDITDSTTWPDALKGQFDALIFQFPLIPSFSDREAFEKAGGLTTNLLNRRLLRLYLQHAFRFFLDPDGQQLALISSKDVKPYSQWDLECGIHLDLSHQEKPIQLLGMREFNQSDFDGYRIRNVDRDKQIRGTKGTTYYWGLKPATSYPDQQLIEQLSLPTHPVGEPVSEHYCNWCKTGPFASAADRQGHLESRRHRAMQSLDKDWRDYLAGHYQQRDYP